MGPSAAELVACGKQLRKLSLFNSRLGDPGAFRVAELAAADSLTSLLELELSACSIGVQGMQSLFGALQTGVAPALEVPAPTQHDHGPEHGHEHELELNASRGAS